MVLLVLGERLLWGWPLPHDGFQTRRETGDTTRLVKLMPSAIADVGEAGPSRLGRVRFESGRERRVNPNESHKNRCGTWPRE